MRTGFEPMHDATADIERQAATAPEPPATWPGDCAYIERRARELAGDPRLARRYRDAAAILRGDKTLGRPDEADAEAIERVLWLVAHRRARSIRAASRMVAETLSGEHSVESAARRIAGKARLARKAGR